MHASGSGAYWICLENVGRRSNVKVRMSGAHEEDVVSFYAKRSTLKFTIIYARAQEMINSTVMTG